MNRNVQIEIGAVKYVYSNAVFAYFMIFSCGNILINLKAVPIIHMRFTASSREKTSWK